mmetsp:Transcript_20143/g.33961  ORF Transcript_20143/g.33961 Transcript_20143/m.33961 type:complete len:429 (+) Transcript_20143:88-1374(+)
MSYNLPPRPSTARQRDRAEAHTSAGLWRHSSKTRHCECSVSENTTPRLSVRNEENALKLSSRPSSARSAEISSAPNSRLFQNEKLLSKKAEKSTFGQQQQQQQQSLQQPASSSATSTTRFCNDPESDKRQAQSYENSCQQAFQRQLPRERKQPSQPKTSPRSASAGIPQTEQLWLGEPLMNTRPRGDLMPSSWKSPKALTAAVRRKEKRLAPLEVRKKAMVAARGKRQERERWLPHLAAVEALGAALPRVPQDLLGSDEFLMECVRLNPACLSYVPSGRFQKRDFLLGAVDASEGRAMKFCPESMRGNFWFVLEAVEKNGRAVKHASAKLRDTGEIVIAAISPDQGDEAKALSWASSDLRNDRNFLRLCLAKNPWCFDFLPPKFKGDLEFEQQTALSLIHNFESEGHGGIHLGLYPTQKFPFASGTGT